MTDREISVIGRAMTAGQALPLGVDDPVLAARAVRRALADAGKRAVDVEAIVVATGVPIASEVLAAFARRALGPHGDRVPVAGLTHPGWSALALAELASGHLAAVGLVRGGTGIALGIGPDGTSLALCLSTRGGSAGTLPGPR